MACATVRATEPARLAVLSIDQSGWNDLLLARLSKCPSVALLERGDLGKALDEVALQDLLVDRTKRSRFGEITGADFLALLEVTGNRARLIVCDTHLGVTLQERNTGVLDQSRKEDLDILANTILQTIESFAGGIKQVVAVPDFVCRDLTFDYSFLQSDYAELLRSAYRQTPGSAIVAVEEAKAIAAERDIAGLGQKERFVSVFIEGEYRTTHAPQGGGVGVEITLRARDASKVLLERKLPSVAPIQAGRELMSVFAKELAGLAPPGGTKINEDAQYRLLIERAEEFSMLGEFQRSAALREASASREASARWAVRPRASPADSWTLPPLVGSGAWPENLHGSVNWLGPVKHPVWPVSCSKKRIHLPAAVLAESPWVTEDRVLACRHV